MNEKKDLVTGLKVSFTFKDETLTGVIMLVYPDAIPSGKEWIPITLVLIVVGIKAYHIKPVNILEIY